MSVPVPYTNSVLIAVVHTTIGTSNERSWSTDNPSYNVIVMAEYYICKNLFEKLFTWR